MRDRGRQADGEIELKEELYQGSRTGSAEWKKKEEKEGERKWQQEREKKC